MGVLFLARYYGHGGGGSGLDACVLEPSRAAEQRRAVNEFGNLPSGIAADDVRL